MMDNGSPEMPPIFEKAEGDGNSDLLDMDEMEKEDDDSTFPVEQSRRGSGLFRSHCWSSMLLRQWTAICMRSANGLQQN